MSASTTALGSVLTSFFNDHLKLQRGLRPNSITSYADAMRLLLQFAAATGKKKVTQLGLDDLNADVVCRFLNSLEESRSNAAQSRNQRLAALRTFFEYIGQRFPERLGQAQKVTCIPRKCARACDRSITRVRSVLSRIVKPIKKASSINHLSMCNSATLCPSLASTCASPPFRSLPQMLASSDEYSGLRLQNVAKAIFPIRRRGSDGGAAKFHHNHVET